ncbi:Gfo/Idh/MocA family protein [Larkinella soli]|uniref:Gfo/Idh/MocA family protein n=1 Tax=Larkinella soli TaxID=1770527 RepID=UPI000FFC1551|nr:Gfo/Idh/MocA family oxidoreductase [Larkinella soli]
MKRRDFLKTGTALSAGLALPTLVPASVFGPHAPSNRITVGFIGTGRQAVGANMPGFFSLPDVQIVAVCDVDRWRMEQARQVVDQQYGKTAPSGSYKSCRTYDDFREVIARRDIDALMISSPDHWHVAMGIMAAQARKPFSIEKPLSLSVKQGRRLCEAVKKSGVVTRTDSEFRSLRNFNQAVELVRNGRLGRLERVEITFPSDPAPVAPQPDMPVPKELNYDLWLGPAPVVPYTEKRVHTPFDLKIRPNWMRIDTYAQGMISNWGAHYFDIAQWANNTENSGPVEVEGRGEFPKSLWNSMINFEVRYRYANGVEMTARQTPDSKPSIRFTGSTGWVQIDGYPGTITAGDPKLLQWKPEKGELDLSGTLTDKGDFIAAVKSGKPSLEPVEVGHRTISISQIGLIACQVGEKLRWNPAREEFEGADRANALLAAPAARNPWAI